MRKNRERKILVAIATLLMSTALFSCGSGGSNSNSQPVVNASGTWSLVTTSIQQFDTTGGACLSGSGSMSINNSGISGNFTGNGALNEVSGTVESNGSVVAQFTRDGATIGNVLGSFTNLSGSGTWADVFGCSGDWTATQ